MIKGIMEYIFTSSDPKKNLTMRAYSRNGGSKILMLEQGIVSEEFKVKKKAVKVWKALE